MDSPTYRITTANGVVIADGLPMSAPAIQLHEGKLAKVPSRHPTLLDPGQSVEVIYPLDAEKGQKRPELRCTVTRTDVANETAPAFAGNEASPSYTTFEVVDPGQPFVSKPVKRGGRRSRKVDVS